MMKVEFDKMEKYWRDKLESERDFYENHIQQSDAKFYEFQYQIQAFKKHSIEKLPTLSE